MTNIFEDEPRIEEPRGRTAVVPYRGQTPREPSRNEIKTLPHNFDAEKAILACCLISEKAYRKIEARVTTETFYIEAHQTIWRAIDESMKDGSPADLIKVTDTLEKTKELEQVGGAAYVTELFIFVASDSGWEYYVKACNDCQRKRTIWHTAQQMLLGAMDPAIEAEEIQATAEGSLRGIMKKESTASAIGELLDERIEQWELAIKTKGQSVMGLLSGIPRWDEATLGFRPKTLHVIAGDSKAGKTTLALQMITYSALTMNRPVGIVSMEMSKESLVDKVVCGEGRVSMRKLAMGQLSPDELDTMASAIAKLRDKPIHIIEESSMTPTKFRALARRLKEEERIKLLVVDYIQLMDGDDTKKPREQQVNEIGKMLKTVANELGIGIVVIAQLNDDGKIRESRSLKMHADTVSQIQVAKGGGNKRWIKIEYNRDGPCDKIPCVFHKEHGRFEESFDTDGEEED